MRLLILSDLHREIWCREQTRSPGDGKTEPLDRIDPSTSRPDVVVLAGDIDVGSRAIRWADETFRGIPVIYVHGNHEGYGHSIEPVVADIAAACKATDHVHYLNMGELVLDGVRFLGATLWTDFQLYGEQAGGQAMDDAASFMNDYRLIRLAGEDYRRLSPIDTVRWHVAERTWLASRLVEPFEGKTVVVTHMAPSERSIAEKFRGDSLTPAFASHLDHLVDQADLWVHGHVHHSLDYRVGRRGRVVCNPLGYPGRPGEGSPENPKFDPNLIVEV